MVTLLSAPALGSNPRFAGNWTESDKCNWRSMFVARQRPVNKGRLDGNSGRGLRRSSPSRDGYQVHTWGRVLTFHSSVARSSLRTSELSVTCPSPANRYATHRRPSVYPAWLSVQQRRMEPPHDEVPWLGPPGFAGAIGSPSEMSRPDPYDLHLASGPSPISLRMRRHASRTQHTVDDPTASRSAGCRLGRLENPRS